MAAIKKRGNSYQIIVSMGYTPSGKQIRKSMTWKIPSDMKAKEAKRRVQIVANEFEEKLKNGYKMEKCTLEEYIIKWLDNKKSELQPKTLQQYTLLSVRIIEHLGNIRLNKLLPKDIQAFYAFLKNEKGLNTGKTLAAETQRHYHRFLSSVLREAYKLQIIDRDIMNHVIAPKAKDIPKKILDDEQSKKFVASLLGEKDLRKKTALLLLVYSGCRIGELLGLEWSDVDFANHSIFIQRASQYINRQIITKCPKTKESQRIISLPPELFPILMEYKRHWLETTKCIDIHYERLFLQKNGKPLFVNTINKWLKKILRDHGLPEVSAHSLRHTNITLQLLAGVPLRQVSARAGHKNPTTTSNIYSHALQSADKLAAEKLAEVLPLGNAELAEGASRQSRNLKAYQRKPQ